MEAGRRRKCSISVYDSPAPEAEPDADAKPTIEITMSALIESGSDPIGNSVAMGTSDQL